MSAPFGIEMNSPLAALDVLEDVGEAKYFISPPRPHPRFDTYIVQASDSLGVVWVKGISADIPDDAYGFRIRTLMDEVSAQLQRRYGAGEATDFLFPGALWDEDRDWVMSVLQNERAYSYAWMRGKAELPGDLAHVYLGILARDRDTTALIIEYGSTDLDKSQQELQEKMSDLL